MSPPKAVIIGDSIARGASDTGEELRATETFTFHMFAEGLFVTTMAHHLGMAVNLPRYNEALEEQNAFDPWKFTMVMLGTNDFSVGTRIAEVADRYGAFLDQAVASLWYQHPKVPQAIFCVTPLTRGDETEPNQRGYTLEKLRSAIRDLCEARSLPVVDGPDLLPVEPGLRRGHPSTYFTDGLHLNAKGHRLLGQHLLNAALNYFATHPTPHPQQSLSEDGRQIARQGKEAICRQSVHASQAGPPDQSKRPDQFL